MRIQKNIVSDKAFKSGGRYLKWLNITAKFGTDPMPSKIRASIADTNTDTSTFNIGKQLVKINNTQPPKLVFLFMNEGN